MSLSLENQMDFVSPGPNGTLTTAVETRLTEQAGRSMLLKSRSSEVSLFVPLDLWATAERVREKFRVESTGSAVDHDGDLNEFELVAAFMQHTFEARRMLARDSSLRIVPFLRAVFSEFCGRFLKGNDPHAAFAGLAKSYSLERILCIFYDVEALLKQDGGPALRIRNTPALFSGVLDREISVMAIFGGQGNTEDLLGELLALHQTYNSLLSGYLEGLAAVLVACAEDAGAKDLLGKGFDVLRWISDAESRPANSYLMKAPVSLPLVGLIQLLNYWVTLKVLDWSPAELAAKIAGATGHSQGIISAAVIAASRTEDEFVRNSQQAMRLLFWIGLRAQQAFPEATLTPNIVRDSLENGEGHPTPMLSVSNLEESKLRAQIAACNEHLPADRQIELGLVNGPKSFVCCGPPQSLYGLNLRLRKLKADPSEDQSRIPFAERKAKLSTRFLPISAPFHCAYLQRAVPRIMDDCQRFGIALNARDLSIPVFHTLTGKELKGEEGSLVQSLVEQICVEHVDWAVATGQARASHILDFGPGHASGIGALTHRNKDGSGVQIILAGSLSTGNGALQTKRALFDSDPRNIVYGPDWRAAYAPRLTEANGRVYVDTRFSRLLGRPPVMVAGMTPCTVAEPFCTAILRAGYHVELAGGGHHNEAVLRAKIDAIIAKVGTGCSITLNALFLNPRLWAFQYPLVKQLRAEGYPVDGFTVAAGVPSFENGCEIVESLREAGIRHVAFKPGSVEAIYDVVRIAKACPRMPVVLQWTGGRGGGHHSFEDFHQPILETYSAIRAVPSLYLVAGSGFGDGPGSLPYLSGEWSRPYRVSPMPFDGILLGSRVMVAAESMASGPVKDLIVQAEGTQQEGDWVRSYTEPVGGVVTVRSELGEPIHKIATRGVLLWKELDETLFQLPKEKRLAAVLKKKAYLIDRFNADHQKVWFGRKIATGRPCDLAEMTYHEVCTRLGELCYVAHQGRWIDGTYKRLLHLFMARIEERFAPTDASSILSEDRLASDDSPTDRIEPFFAAYPAAKERLLNPEDTQAFLALCAIPWHKPVPFIPTLDDDKLEYWFKKDSLWQAEDLDAVVGQDPGRVCILHGPVAAGYSTKANQPVKEILDEINDYHVQALKDAGVPVSRDVWFGGQPIAYPVDLAKALAVEVIGAGGQPVSQFQLPAEEPALPTPCQWLEVLAGPGKSWLRALLRSQHVTQGPKDVVVNRVRNLLRPRPRQLAEIDYLPDGRTPNSLKISDDGDKERVLITYEPNLRRIRLTISYDRGDGTAIPLLLLFRFNPAHPYGLIEEEMADRNERIRQFYWRLWYGPGREAEYAETKAFDLLHGVFECASRVDPERVKSFCRIVGNHAEAYLDGSVAPMDYGMVACWEAVVRALFVDAIDGDLLSLVHLWNEIEYCSPGGALITANALFTTRAKVMGVTVGPSGKTVRVQAEAFNADGQAVLRVTTAFLFRGHFNPSQLQFERIREDTFVLEFKSHGDVAIFREKAWIRLPQDPKIGDVLYFQDLVSFQQRLPDGALDIEVTGSIAIQGAGLRFQEVGRVAFSGKALAGNPVTSYLKRAGRAVKEEHLFEEPQSAVGLKEGLAITTSTSNAVYSACSGDHNPIHTCPLIADYVGLPGTITHGLWTAAAVRALVETYAGENRALAVTKFRADFVDMVLPGQALQTKLRHVGMQNGVKLYSVETRCGDRLVLRGRAEVEQPRTAYIFTGQGSQEPGMGMDLYASSPVAKAIWDRADAHFRANYGFSILEIIRRNPKTLQVHFGGPRGAHIRKHYTGLVYETVSEDGHGIVGKRLFPEITESSLSYTFTSPAGLLSMTQFTQPAICLVEKVAFEVMRSKGLVCPSAAFAGHSLGEYAALASVGDVLGLETLCDVVFYRGMSMQVAVERDADGRSPYGMAAINPSRVQAGFTQDAMHFVIGCVQKRTNLLLEIVNYNVQDWQYVVAGHLNAIECLTQTLNYINVSKFDCASLVKAGSANPSALSQIEEGLYGIIDEVRQKIDASLLKSGQTLVVPQRGLASIPLPGIDVPFHSSFLLNGVAPFRAFLAKRIVPAFVEPVLLEGKYIPNLTAKPFRLSREYIQAVYDTCHSPVLKDVLASCTPSILADPQESRVLATKLMIELLAYQFASPVRWIESQDVLFQSPLATERLIEIGPAPTLSGMAERTLRAKFEVMDDAMSYRRVILSHAKDKADIYYENTGGGDDGEDGVADSPSTAPAQQAAADVPTPAAPAIQQAPPPPQPQPGSTGNTKPIDSLPMEAAELLQIIVCTKMKKPAAQVPLAKTLKELSGGKSTLQNELMADLQKEFGGAAVPERAEETSLQELASALGKAPTFTRAPGKHVAGLIAKMASSKFPAGFNASSAKAFLAAEFALSPSACDTIFAFALLSEPEARLGSEEAAKAWLRGVATDYFKAHGIELAAPSSGASAGTAAISSAELEKIQAKHKALLRQQIELYLAYLQDGSAESKDKSLGETSAEVARLQAQLDYWTAEHGGEEYAEGIQPIFSALKARRYDSWWNWARQTALELYSQSLAGTVAGDEETLAARISSLTNRADGNLVDFLEYLAHGQASAFHPLAAGERGQLAKHLADSLWKEARRGLDTPPVFRPFGKLTGPHTSITEQGRIEYKEVPRPKPSFSDYVSDAKQHNWLHLASRDATNAWARDAAQSALYLEALKSVCTAGLSFAGKTFLMTGGGRASIGGEMLRGLLGGGATVVLTTSSYSRANLEHFRALYEECGAKGSALLVVPFNQASRQDVDSLIGYIYGELGSDVDGIIPFGAISEAGRSLLDGVEARSELAHRLMLTNVLRLLGAVARAKASRGITTRPAQVLLPLSPNHGTFGHDGLYGESKAALETLLQKWHSEAWNDYLSIVGAVIGWTRGTGLMSENNLVAEEIERLGVHTFSVAEMALNLLGLMHPDLVRLAESSPIYADLNGGMSCLRDLHLVTRSIRAGLQSRSDLLLAKHREALEEAKQVRKADAAAKNGKPVEKVVERRANFDFGFRAKTGLALRGHPGLAELLDLEQVVVAVGFGEVGPWGNARTRWEMEAHGCFSLEGCIQLAWLMGLIRYGGDGWVDAATGEPVPDAQVKARYEARILAHTGIRVIEPEVLNGYDPQRKWLTQEVALSEDMRPVEVSAAEAEQFRLEHGDKAVVAPVGDGSDRCLLTLRKGAVLYIPKALRFDRFVAGLVPAGWSAERYGVPRDIVDQVDPITLFVLVSTVEALVAAGITDPYEFYQYVHLAELGNVSGGGVGGQRSNQRIFRSRFLDRPVQSDILQESFINTMPAWVNLLLLSSAGPIKTPVGACATAVESIDIGVETILSGKARVVIAGGYDDFREEGSFEFAAMQATSSAAEEAAKGREPGEMSRPMASSRAGFMESQGAGIQVLMTAQLAIEMGCPIYGVIAAVNTATDKEGRSVPAPGQGILTTARAIPSTCFPRALDIDYRLKQLRKAKAAIHAWYEEELEECRLEAAAKFVASADGEAFLSARTNDLRLEAGRRLAAEQRQWGQEFGHGDPRIAPLAHALARFGLSVDDIGVASFHGTGTRANDTNESAVLQRQLEQLGRSRGNVCLAVCQKYLTGHPKGAAAAWMLNGVLQAMNEGLVPGNRNADNVEDSLHDMSLIFYPTKPVRCQVRAALLKSFGFGQVGGEVLVLHPDIVLGTLAQPAYEAYLARRGAREARAQAHTYRSLVSPADRLIKLKEAPPFPADLESQAYLDPTVRAAYDPAAKSWVIGKAQLEASKKAFPAQTAALTKSLVAATSGARGVGIDVQLITDLPIDNADFLERNYTPAELEYCRAQPDVQASLAGRWAAKEAALKALCSSAAMDNKPDWLQGPGAPLKDIEVLPSPTGAPAVRVKGKPMDSLKVSISHSGAYAVALAQLP